LSPIQTALFGLFSQTMVPWGALANGTIVGEGRSEGSRRAVGVNCSHPLPGELRAGFRRLLTSCKTMLLIGDSVRIRLEDGPAILSILPLRSEAAATGKWKGTRSNDLRTGEEPLTLGSATLFVRGADQKTTGTGESHVVLWDLEAVFAALVVRDRHFKPRQRFSTSRVPSSRSFEVNTRRQLTNRGINCWLTNMSLGAKPWDCGSDYRRLRAV
jgi:hypothetical protein